MVKKIIIVLIFGFFTQVNIFSPPVSAQDIVDSGVSVLYVAENSPAQKGGFKPGDLIVDIPEMKEPQASMWDYFNLLKNRKPQDKVTFKVLRNLKERLDITVEIGSYSEGKEGW